VNKKSSDIDSSDEEDIVRSIQLPPVSDLMLMVNQNILIEKLRKENEELLKRIEELERLLKESRSKTYTR
jgi:predicted ATP-grasp superfamily ATP-dependent carboligase